MSVLIKGMDMPSACNKCQFHNACICTAKGSPVSLQIYLYDKKPCDCPLAEIPTPHGRLIDADRFSAVLKNIRVKCIYDREKYMIDLITKEFKKAPTIIEAEGE